MDEYISREAAISKIRDEGVLGGDYDAYEREEDVVNTLKSIPAADVVKVRHGRWEYIGGYGYQFRCSECILCAEYKTKYCPNCGAKMDGGQEA